jgi:K+-transporting ATPase KdpF subunit
VFPHEGSCDGNPHDRIDGCARRGDLVAFQARRGPGDTPMSIMEWIGVVLSVGVAVYLFVALLYPEKFE